MKKFRPLLFVIILLGAIVFLVFRIISTSLTYVPPEFFEARNKGARFAEEIVDLSRQSLTRLTQISELDQERKFTEALAIVSEELIEYQKSQNTAAQLASQLEIMARLLPDIKSQKAREIGAEAISTEVALVSRLVTYNDKLRDLFIVLQLKFNTRNVSGELDGRVNELITEINEQAKAINQFNQRFNDAMEEFDRKFR
jgi:uncharacterized phage infection (PIP) family protein YhgE